MSEVVRALGLSTETIAWTEEEAAQGRISDILKAWRKRSG
jgi:hypothetical protein